MLVTLVLAVSTAVLVVCVVASDFMVSFPAWVEHKNATLFEQGNHVAEAS